MKMKILNLEQGTPEWLEARTRHFCASDAPAMMGVSKYKSRTQLLHEKKTGQCEEVDSFKQGLFDKGHAAENAARDIIEMNECENYAPVVGVIEVEGFKLLASLDGLNESGEIVYEHKLYNKILAANVANVVLEPMHYWQLEHQLLVSGADKVWFVCSDGTEEQWEEMFYISVPERRAELIAGWSQFVKDLEAYKVEAKTEPVVAASVESFPLIKYEIQGSLIVSNITEALPLIMDRAEIEMNRILETDQDFADKESLNKATVKARASLKEVVENAKSEFVSFSEFAETAAQIDSVLQKMQAQGEKQVKDAKEKKKKDIEMKGQAQVDCYVLDINKKIAPLSLAVIGITVDCDFQQATKGKRNLESLQSAVDLVVVQMKLEIDKAMSKVIPNQIFMREHGADFKFLFADVAQIINQDIEPFQAIVKSRIAEHKAAEEKKAADLRDTIRKEEEEKVAKKIEAEKKPAVVEPEVKEDLGRPFDSPESAPAETATTPKEEPVKAACSDPFVNDVMAWQKKYGIIDAAIDELVLLLGKYGK